MVDVKLRNLTKHFGETVAVDDLTFQANEGELCTLLGPSGCGKSTTLRCIAGFYVPDKGEIYFGDKLINNVPPYKRNTGMVFQNYALWPHMTVFDNVAYGLKQRNVSKEEIKKKVNEILQLVHLTGFEGRRPSQLSGGQQQRIALARALVVAPDVLLLDEPLSNLDAKLRVEMRTEIKRIQNQLKITTIYVTHDQEEALSISDKLVVMNAGKAQQIGTPRDVYEKPANQFVAYFVGMANFIKGKIEEIRGDTVSVATEYGVIKAKGDVKKDTPIIISVRPEAFSIHKRGVTLRGMNLIDGVVKFTTYLGNVVRYEVETSTGALMKVDLYNPKEAKIFQDGEKVTLAFKSDDATLIPI